MKNRFIQGAIIIMIASLISKILGSVFRIPLQNIAGDEVFGIFTIVYPVYMTALILSVAGIPTAISKLISEERSHGNEGSIYHIFTTSQILAILFGVLSFAIIVLFSHPIANILGGSYTRLALIVVASTLLVAPFMAVYRGFFQGYEEMNPTAISQVIEQFVRVGFILLFAYLLTKQGYSADIVAGGIMIGSLIGAFSSYLYLQGVMKRRAYLFAKKQALNFHIFRKWSKRILMLSLPICIGALTMAFINFIDSITVPKQLENIGYESLQIAELYSYYGRGQALVQIVVVFAQALTLPLIPLISRTIAKNDLESTSEVVGKALRFVFLTAWPATIGLFVLTEPINYALFGDFQENTMIAVVHLSALFTAVAVLTTGMLQGMNRSIRSAIIVMTMSAVKIALNIVLIQYFGLLGVALSTFFVYLILTGWNIWTIRKTVFVPLWRREYLIFALAALIMGVVVYIPSIWLDMTELSRAFALGYVTLMVVIGALIYSFLLILFKGITLKEIKELFSKGKSQPIEEQK